MPVTAWSIVGSVISHARTCLLYGPPGTGKSHAAHQAALDGRKLFSITITQDTPAAELRGHYVPQGDRFVWQDGPAVTAWREGARLVVNEVDHAGGDCLSFMLALLDNPATAMMTLPNGETVRPAEGFQCIATMNGEPDEALPPALRDRFPVAVHIQEAHPDAIDSLPEDLRQAAKGTVAAPGDRRITLRAWLAFAGLREKVGMETAAQAVFGTDRAGDVLASLKIGAA